MATLCSAAVLSPARFRKAPKRASARSRSAVWRLDLRPFGYRGGRPRPESSEYYPGLDPICFSDGGTLIASFVTQEGPQPLARRGSPNQPLPFRLHALFIDSANGGLRSQPQWPIPHPAAGVLCAPDGDFIVATNELLTLYSAGLEKLASLRLSASPAWDIFQVLQSPGRRSLLLVYASTSPAPHLISAAELGKYLDSIRRLYWWVDGRSLSLRHEWIAGIEPPTAVSDTEVVTVKGSREPSGRAIMAGAPGGPSHPIWTGPDASGSPRFVGDHVLALFWPRGFRLISSAGTPMLNENFGGSELLGTYGHYPAPSAAEGGRFAIAVWGVRGGSRVLDISGHAFLKRVMVFDLRSRRWIYTLNAKKEKIKTIHGLAVSPDGTLLALINQDGILEVFRLPPTDPSRY